MANELSGIPPLPILLTTLYYLITHTHGEICNSDVCEFHLVISRRRSMTYTSKNDKTYNVEWNSTANRLQIVENSYRKKEQNPVIGDFVEQQDVITTDGFSRNIIVINDMFPGPTLEVREGAQVVVVVENRLHSEAVSVHWHGMEMNNNVWMDGAGYITQCPILPYQKFSYRFMAQPVGTHWYHGHFSNQRLDGLYGALLVHKHTPVLPYHIITVQDWFHKSAETMQIMDQYSATHTAGTGEASSWIDTRFYLFDGSEATAITYVSSLVGGRGRQDDSTPDTLLPLEVYNVVSGQRYHFHVINTGAEFSYELMIDNHKMMITGADGHDLQPVAVNSFIVAPGERVDFEVEANQVPGSYWIRAEVNKHSEVLPYQFNASIHGGKAILTYGDEYAGEPVSSRLQCTANDQCIVFNCPYPGYPTVAYKHCIGLNDVESQFTNSYLSDKYGINDQDYEEIFLNIGFHIGSSINGRKFAHPTAPLFRNEAEYTVECDDEACESGCYCTNTQILEQNKTIQLVISNHHPGELLDHHVMHMHGHSFAVIKVGYAEHNQSTGFWMEINPDVQCDTASLCAHPNWNNGIRPQDFNTGKPPVKDSVVVPAKGYVVVRFKANNPGYWLLHCHMSSHHNEGMSMLFNVAPGAHPPLPSGFETCGNFQWDEEEFTRYRNGQMRTVTLQTTTTTVPATTPTLLDLTKIQQCIDGQIRDENTVVMDLDIFIGGIVGFILLGAVLVLLPVLCFACLTARRMSPGDKA